MLQALPPWTSDPRPSDSPCPYLWNDRLPKECIDTEQYIKEKTHPFFDCSI